MTARIGEERHQERRQKVGRFWAVIADISYPPCQFRGKHGAPDGLNSPGGFRDSLYTGENPPTPPQKAARTPRFSRLSRPGKAHRNGFHASQRGRGSWGVEEAPVPPPASRL